MANSDELSVCQSCSGTSVLGQLPCREKVPTALFDTVPTLLSNSHGQLSQATLSTSLLVLHAFVGTEDAVCDCCNHHAPEQVDTIAECALPSITALVDSGAFHSFVEHSIVVHNVLPCLDDAPRMVTLADGTSVVLHAVAHVPVLFEPGVQHVLEYHVVDKLSSPVILGMTCL